MIKPQLFHYLFDKVIPRLGYVTALFAVLALFFLGKITEGSSEFASFYVPLLISCAFAIILLFGIVLFYVARFIRHYRQKVPGSGLTLMILLRLLFIGILPLIFISYFALRFLSYEYQSTFNEGINSALDNSLTLSKSAINAYAVQHLNQTQKIAKLLSRYNRKDMMFAIERVRQDTAADELSIYDNSGFIQGFASATFTQPLPNLMSEEYANRLRYEGDFFVITSLGDDYRIDTYSKIAFADLLDYYLHASFTIPNTVSQLAKQVEETISEREQFHYLRPKVSSSFSMVLLLVILLSGLLLLLAAIHFASVMVTPIRELIKGTRNIARGRYEQKITYKQKDDLGLLIEAFNHMADTLANATQAQALSEAEAESERAYLSAVIRHINSAVMTLDHQKRLLMYNQQAERLLDVSLRQAVLVEPDKLPIQLANYVHFLKQLPDAQMALSIEKEVSLPLLGEDKQLLVSMTALPNNEVSFGGYVVIFSDLTEYWRRQKEAAWEEVARRLAHEIKNPLTPILLAAERLNYKLAEHLPEKEKALLNRAISVISAQVNAMKVMVDDFSAYAKPSSAKKIPLHIHPLIQEVAFLYRGQRVRVVLDLQADNDLILGNANLLRQVLHNVIKNAVEAVDEQQEAVVHIDTQNALQADKSVIFMSIKDNGAGIKQPEKIFEPYVTSKEKGTGLGLAIVKKIIDEHAGSISAKNAVDESSKIGGAIITIELPSPATQAPLALGTKPRDSTA